MVNSRVSPLRIDPIRKIFVFITDFFVVLELIEFCRHTSLNIYLKSLLQKSVNGKTMNCSYQSFNGKEFAIMN